jgi:hypothetical protein
MKPADYRLGMPYCVVDANGVVALKLVKKLEFSDQDDISSPIKIDSKMSVEDFEAACYPTNAYRKARENIEICLRDTSRSIKDDEVLRERLTEIQQNKSSMCARLLQKMLGIMPQEHFSLGTMLWYAQPEHWNIQKGPLVQLDMYQPESVYGCPQYKNGQFPGVTHTANFFDSEEAALDYLGAEFQKRLPGILMRSEVKISQTMTVTERLDSCW